MIHEFAVSNYFSIYEEAVLDLRIPGTAPDLPRFRRSKARPDVRLPTVTVIVGPNGSGKTTLLRALVDVTRVTWASGLSTAEAPIDSILPFLSKKAHNEPTRFRVEFDAAWLNPGKALELFRYELSVGRTLGQSNFILREALFHFPKGRPRRLFERGAPGETIYVAREFGLTSKDPRLDAVGPKASVVATLAVLNVPLAERIAEGVKQVSVSTNILYHGNWQPPTKEVVDWYERDDMMRDWMKQQMQRSDLAIQDVSFTSDSTGNKQVYFHHRDLDVAVLLPFESGGTRRLFHLLPQIRFALDTGGQVILDEVDGDLHVDIVNEVIHWFHNRETNPHNAQFLVTAHNVGVLDDLEKEELFIVEKGPDSATRVHAAQDVSGLRRDTRLYSKYRSGVLGGLPKIG